MNELISVIVPVYNAQPYLEKCLNSICNQTYKNLEIILINDGSCDRSENICASFAEKDERIVFMSQKNSGVSAARNAGLEIAKGSYIGFVDSDDWIDNKMYEVLYKLISENNSDMAQIGYCREYQHKKVNIKAVDIKITNNEAMLDAFWIKGYVGFSLWNKLFKKELWKDIRMDSKASIRDDVVALYEMLSKINKFVSTSQALYHYAQTPNSITRNDFSKGIMDVLVYTADFKLNLMNCNYRDIKIKSRVLIACCNNMIELYDKSFRKELTIEERNKYSLIALDKFHEYFDCLTDIRGEIKLKEKAGMIVFLNFPKLHRQCRLALKIFKNICKKVLSLI